MSNLITSENKFYTLGFTSPKGLVYEVHFLSGWQMIDYLSSINAEAQKN